MAYYADLADPLIGVRCAVYGETARILGVEAEVWVTEDLRKLPNYRWPHPYHRLLLQVTSPDGKVNMQVFKDRALDVFNTGFPKRVMDVIMKECRQAGFAAFDPR